MRKRNDPMLFVHKHGKEYRVKIQGYEHGSLISAIFYRYEYGTYAKAKKAAIEFRDEILQELEDDRIYSISWTPNLPYFINGLGLEVGQKRLCARTPYNKGLPGWRRFSYGPGELREAFDRAIEALQKYKRGSVYPDWVIEEAWKRVKEQSQLCINLKIIASIVVDRAFPD